MWNNWVNCYESSNFSLNCMESTSKGNYFKIFIEIHMYVESC